MKAKRLFFKECNLAGRRYYDADLVCLRIQIAMLNGIGIQHIIFHKRQTAVLL